MKISVKKINFEDLFYSTTMFYVNHDYEKKNEQIVQSKVEKLAKKLNCIDTKNGLKKYIVEHKDSLEDLTTLLEVSTERFKRMVSMIRKDRGFVFSTEWNLNKIRNAMIENPAMMESILNLLWDGRNDNILKEKIPYFYLDNMGINDVTLKKLQDKATLRSFVKKGLEGKYSNNIGDLILIDIEKRIQDITMKYGLKYERNVRVPLFDRAVSFVVETPLDPRIVIDVSYCVTTSSSQGDKRNVARETENRIKKERDNGRNIVYINFLDGAGWIGRQADMKEIHRCSDYVLNFNNLNLLEDIISAYLQVN